MNQERVVSVSSVLQRIKLILSQTFDFSTVWIQGEISNLTKHRSGHYYFSLKDADGEMNCVMFASYVRHLDFSLEEGMKVQVQASVNVYETRGTLQLMVKKMRADGIGDLFLEYQQRLKRLQEQGYFDAARKKPKPAVIEKAAVITAKEGAALQDVLKTVQKRWPMLDLILYPAYVQGNLAPRSLITQIKKADRQGYDAILVVRGGGSFEDLFCFNDEELVKTLYDCHTYTVSGVGHEVDTTLTDLVCDHRAVTPTAAAQWITPDQFNVSEQIDALENRMVDRMRHLLSQSQQRYTALIRHPYLQDPMSWAMEKQLKLDTLSAELDHAVRGILSHRERVEQIPGLLAKSLGYILASQKQKNAYQRQDLCRQMTYNLSKGKDKLAKQVSLLDAYSPLKVLSRGYSIVRKDDVILKDSAQVQNGDIITVCLSKGSLQASVISEDQNERKTT